VAHLATRSWGAADPAPGTPGAEHPAPGSPGAEQPDPGLPGAEHPDPGSPGAGQPAPGLPGPPIREGSPTGIEGGGVVHRPLALLIHGVTSSSRTWWRVGPALAGRGFRVLAVDLPGHGASPRTVDELSLADLAGDVAETVLAQVGETVPPGAPGPVDLLVGHSLGALVALELVRARPGFGRRLVVEDPPGPRSVDWAALAAGIEADTGRAAADPEPLRRDLEAANPSWPPGEAERRVADLADCDGRAVAAAARPGIAFDLAALLAAARLPTLLLLGEESLGSNLTGLDRKAAVEAVAAQTIRVLPAGHSLHREALDAWLAALDTWLAAP
jgi:pimeloyl-ACP methyl ester carboxylesterase